MANTVTVYNFKGGVGKTTTTLNLGYSWSRSFKVLLIDFDPQCNLTNALSFDHHRHTLYDYLKNELHDHPFKADPVAIHPYLHLIPGAYHLAQFESNNQFIAFGPDLVKRILNRLEREYDLILMDCPTNFGVLVRSVLASTRSILIPALADSFSISGIGKVLAHLNTLPNAARLNILGVFFNMYSGHTILNGQKFNEAKGAFGDLILDQTIGRSIKVGEAMELGRAISQHEPDNPVAKEFMALSDELLAKFDNLFLTDNLVDAKVYQRLNH